MAECVQIVFLNMKTFVQYPWLFNIQEANKEGPAAKPHLPFLFYLLFAIAFLASTTAAFSQSPDYAADKANAETFYAEGSYAKAHDVYASMDISSLPKEDARWVQFRLADTRWRSAAATGNPDTSELDAARDSLENQVRDLTREDQHDRIWAEVEESLGDFFWRAQNTDWSSAFPHFQSALDWWAGQSDLDMARTRYLNIVWKMARPPGVNAQFSYGDWGFEIPPDVLENAAKIAQTDEDKAHAHYLMAMTLRVQWNDWAQAARMTQEFESALSAGKKTDWYDAALFNYGQFLEQNGRAVMDKDGNWSSQPDYARALALFRQLTNRLPRESPVFGSKPQMKLETSPARKSRWARTVSFCRIRKFNIPLLRET